MTIVDDHPIVAKGLQALVNGTDDLRCDCVVTEGGQIPQCLKVGCRPDVMVVDLSLKDSDGLDVLKRIRAEAPEIRTLVCSMHDETVYAERALKAGAAGYVMKDEAPERLLDAIRKVLDGGTYLSERMTAVLLKRVRAGAAEGHEALTDREVQVLRLVGEGCATAEIAERLSIGAKTVETYKERLKAKLGLADAAALAKHAVAWARGEA